MKDPSNDYRKLYRRAYALLEEVTPLKVDCGKVCGCRCCQVNGDSVGMLLFPHEETVLKVIECSDGRRLAVCDGTCNRSERPLACRLFPLFPVPDEHGRLEVVEDARGSSLCPLLQLSDSVEWNPRFIRNVRRVGKLLMRQEDTHTYLEQIADEIADLEALRECLTDES